MQLVTNQVTRTQLGAKVALLAHRTCDRQDILHRLTMSPDHDVVFRQHNDATRCFGDGLIDRCNQFTHHGPTIDKIRFGYRLGVFGLEGNDAFARTDRLHGKLKSTDQLARILHRQLLVNFDQRFTFSTIDQVNFDRDREFDVGRKTCSARANHTCVAHLDGNVVQFLLLMQTCSGCGSSADGLV